MIAKMPSPDPAKARSAVRKSAVRARELEDAPASFLSINIDFEKPANSASSYTRTSNRIEEMLPFDEALDFYSEPEHDSLR
jgi:hypothetical protein